MSSATTARRSPRNPWVGFLYAGVALVGAAAGVALLVLDWPRIAASELEGQRTEGLVLTLPVLLGVGGAVALVRAILAIGPWQRDRAAVSSGALRPDGRSSAARPRALDIGLIVLGSLAAAGVVALAFARPATLAGTAALVEVAAALVIGAVVALRAGLSGLRAR